MSENLDLVQLAVENNVAWCSLVCRSHGIDAETRDGLWVTARQPPMLYPDAITLAPGATGTQAWGAVGEREPCALKDSFATLALDEHGFAELFAASWLYHEPTDARSVETPSAWSVVDTPERLMRWTAAADLSDVIGPELLDESSVRLLALRNEENDVIAGAALNRTGPVVGVSNVFASGVAAEDVWAALPAAIGIVFPGLPLVGYEHGRALACAQACGFDKLGELRVWRRSAVALKAVGLEE